MTELFPLAERLLIFNHQGLVNSAKLVRFEANGGSAESLRIDDGGLLD